VSLGFWHPELRAESWLDQGLVIEGWFWEELIGPSNNSIVLTISGGTHAHTADAVALSQLHILTIADATHAHLADNVSLVSSSLLVIADGLSGHTADALALAQNHALEIANALHSHAADSLDLTAAIVLLIASALSGHTADSIDLGYTYAVFGTTKDKQENPVVGATAYLFRTVDGALIDMGYSLSDGKFRLVTGDDYTDHFVVAFYGSNPRKAGVTLDTRKGK